MTQIDRPYVPIPLVYCAPSSQAVPVNKRTLHNAFPDMNERAQDDSLSLPPSRAKYCLPLDALLNPAAKDDQVLRDGVLYMIRVPKADDQYDEFNLNEAFERVHARLAASEEKWLLRIHLLGPLYSEILAAVEAGTPIYVPLTPDDQGNRMERLWSLIVRRFRKTHLLDETVSLLATMFLLRGIGMDIADRERRFVETEAEDHPGFKEEYHRLSSWAHQQFHLGATPTQADYRRAADGVVGLAKLRYSVHWVPEMLRTGRSLEMIANDDDFWQQGTELFVCESPPAPNFIEAIHRVLGLNIVSKDLNQKFASTTEFFEYFMFNLEATPQHTSLRLRYTENFVHLIGGAIVNVDDSSFDYSLMHLLAMSTMVIESIRQQLCTGVGLRCPLWPGHGCCGWFRPLFDRLGTLTRPLSDRWKPHWTSLPCSTQP